MKPKLPVVVVASLLIGVCIGFPIGRLTAPEAAVPTIIPAAGLASAAGVDPEETRSSAPVAPRSARPDRHVARHVARFDGSR